MKKGITFFLTLTLMLALTGCLQQKDIKVFEIENAHKIVVISVDGQQMEITDVNVIERITENIVGLQFEKAESSKDTNGFGPILQWFDSDGTIIEAISIIGEKSIMYNNYFWVATDGVINIKDLDEFLK